MHLTIVNVAYPFVPASRNAVGGAEQIVSALDTALVMAGHRSVVIAAEGSSVCGELVSVPRCPGPIGAAERARTWAAQRAAIRDVLERCSPHALHFHGIDFHEYLPETSTPSLVTLHLPLDWYPAAVLQGRRSNLWFNCVSPQQHREVSLPGFLPCIPNGVAIDQFSFGRRKRRFALALGRICPEKGFHVAINACARAKVPMLLGGEVFPYEDHQRYFREYIQPRLNDACRFVGPLNFRRKRRLLAAACCLLIPSFARETSSLTAMEALASGTPVIAFPSGALSAIVEHGRTGFLVANEAEMARAIDNVSDIDPAVCRQVARERFSQDRMIAQYLDVYAALFHDKGLDAVAEAQTYPASCELAL